MLIYLDCDTGIDDALALALLLARPEVTLAGVGTVNGNTSATQAAANTLGLLALAGRESVPVSVGGGIFRAGPLRCPAPVDGVKSWNVEGKQLSLYDESGSVLARLYASGPGKFDGQTSTGQPISLSR